MKHIDLNDPRLTAYALGELTGDELIEMEQIIAQDEAARKEIESLRKITVLLTEQLSDEPCPVLDPQMRRAIRNRMPLGRITPAFNIWRVAWVSASVTAVLIVGLMSVQRSVPERAKRTKAATDLNDTSTQLILIEEAPASEPAAYAVIMQPPEIVPSPKVGRDAEANRFTGGVVGSVFSVGSSAGRFGPPPQVPNTESYSSITGNEFLTVAQNPLSTFSIDVDTASYSNMRRFLTQNARPPIDSVRIEEFINYFSYNYAPPSPTEDKPFAAHIESATCPWKPGHRLVRIGLKGKIVSQEKRPPSNLVFLIDVSGSMQDQNKLPLVQQSMRLLVEQLTENDRVAMIVYAGSSGLVLPSTTGDNKDVIRQALDRLSAGGSTHGSAGIQLAYETAVANFIKGGSNRVILCTDGDFNVGITTQGDLQRLIEEKAKSGVFLSVLGFGMGNLKDATLETLADKGNGNYAYIDTLNEARKVLVEQMTGTLITIAKDVKIQVEFNPVQVSAYRLIGYENRLLAKEDFSDDTKDAGEIGAGHTVTALYEVVPAGGTVNAPGVDPLKYQQPAEPVPAKLTGSKELLTLKLRYKQPDGDTSKLLEYPYTDSDASFAKASTDFQFASAVAMFGMILRDSPHKGGATLPGVIEVAESSLGVDTEGYRREFVDLAKKAAGMMMPAGRPDVFHR